MHLHPLMADFRRVPFFSAPSKELSHRPTLHTTHLDRRCLHKGQTCVPKHSHLVSLMWMAVWSQHLRLQQHTKASQCISFPPGTILIFPHQKYQASTTAIKKAWWQREVAEEGSDHQLNGWRRCTLQIISSADQPAVGSKEKAWSTGHETCQCTNTPVPPFVVCLSRHPIFLRHARCIWIMPQNQAVYRNQQASQASSELCLTTSEKFFMSLVSQVGSSSSIPTIPCFLWACSHFRGTQRDTNPIMSVIFWPWLWKRVKELSATVSCTPKQSFRNKMVQIS